MALLVAAAGLWLVPSASAAAATTTYYVSPSGNDAAAGSKQKPWRTIQRATSLAPAGSVITVASGTYAPFVVTKANQTVTASSGQSVVVKGRAGVQDVVRVSATGVKLLTCGRWVTTQPSPPR